MDGERAKTTQDAIETVSGRRISTTDARKPPVGEECCVAVEAPLAIDVADGQTYTLMCTPTDTRALVAGFLFTEGMIEGRNDIVVLNECPDSPNVMRVQVRSIEKARKRNLLIASSCGLCGAENVSELLEKLPKVGDGLRVRAEVLQEVAEELRRRQAIFALSGGTHAAAIFGAGGEIVSFAEDLGRHNALDKAIGKCILEGRDMSGCGVVMSGRVSLELVVKCARAGLELASAVSAATSLATQAAERCGITLVAFVREGRATVLTCPGRIEGAATV